MTYHTIPPRPPATPPRWPRLLLAAALLATAAAWLLLAPDSATLWQAVRSRLAEWKRFADENTFLAAAVFFAVYVVSTGLSLPVATALSLTAGALFGRWLGSLLAVTAAACGATLAMLSARYVLRDWVRARFGRRLTPIEDGVARGGAFYLLTLRLIPAVPYFLLNLGMGLTGMRPRTFFAVSWAGMLPAAFVFVNLGTAAAAVESPRGLLSPEVILALSLLGLLPLAARLVARRLRRPGIQQP